MFEGFNGSMLGGLIPPRLANRSTCTINGKSLSDVEKELIADVPEDKIESTHDGYYYVAIDTMLERLNEVVGPYNYTIVPFPVASEPMRYMIRPTVEMVQKQKAQAENQKRAAYAKNRGENFGEEQKVKYYDMPVSDEELIPYENVEFVEKVITAVAIYADTGELAILKYAYGAGSYIVVNETGKLANPKNIPDSVVSDAAKRACKDLGIASTQLQKLKKKKNSGKKSVSGTEIRVILKKNFSTRSGGYYAAPVIVKETGEERELFVGRDAVISSENKEKLISLSVGREFPVIGAYNDFKKNNGTTVPQILLIDVVKNGGKANE